MGLQKVTHINYNVFILSTNKQKTQILSRSSSFVRLIRPSLRVFHNPDQIYRIPSILVTGQGFPPLAVRACVFRLASALDLPVLGLFDCNPFGESTVTTHTLSKKLYGGIEKTCHSSNILYNGLLFTEQQAAHESCFQIQTCSNIDLLCTTYMLCPPLLLDMKRYTTATRARFNK